MDIYKFVRIMNDFSGVNILTTDSQDLDSILQELKTFCPSYRVVERKLPDGKTYGFEMDKLGGKDADVMWWIMQRLCLKGYEPLGASQAAQISMSSTPVYYFRRKGQ